MVNLRLCIGDCETPVSNLRPRLKPVYVSEPETLLLKKPEPETLRAKNFEVTV